MNYSSSSSSSKTEAERTLQQREALLKAKRIQAKNYDLVLEMPPSAAVLYDKCDKEEKGKSKKRQRPLVDTVFRDSKKGAKPLFYLAHRGTLDEDGVRTLDEVKQLQFQQIQDLMVHLGHYKLDSDKKLKPTFDDPREAMALSFVEDSEYNVGKVHQLDGRFLLTQPEHIQQVLDTANMCPICLEGLEAQRKMEHWPLYALYGALTHNPEFLDLSSVDRWGEKCGCKQKMSPFRNKFAYNNPLIMALVGCIKNNMVLRRKLLFKQDDADPMLRRFAGPSQLWPMYHTSGIQRLNMRMDNMMRLMRKSRLRLNTQLAPTLPDFMANWNQLSVIETSVLDGVPWLCKTKNHKKTKGGVVAAGGAVLQCLFELARRINPNDDPLFIRDGPRKRANLKLLSTMVGFDGENNSLAQALHMGSQNACNDVMMNELKGRVGEWFSDMDLFVIAPTATSAARIIRQTLDSIVRAISAKCGLPEPHDIPDFLMFRTARAVTIHCPSVLGNMHIQLVIKYYSSMEDMLLHFDLDPCRVVFDGSVPLVTWAAALSLASGEIHFESLVDFQDDRRKMRAWKYIKRGFVMMRHDVPVKEVQEKNYYEDNDDMSPEEWAKWKTNMVPAHSDPDRHIPACMSPIRTYSYGATYHNYMSKFVCHLCRQWQDSDEFHVCSAKRMYQAISERIFDIQSKRKKNGGLFASASEPGEISMWNDCYSDEMLAKIFSGCTGVKGQAFYVRDKAALWCTAWREGVRKDNIALIKTETSSAAEWGVVSFIRPGLDTQDLFVAKWIENEEYVTVNHEIRIEIRPDDLIQAIAKSIVSNRETVIERRDHAFTFPSQLNHTCFPVTAEDIRIKD